MKNLILEKPSGELSGRFLETVRLIDTKDIKNKKVLDIGCGYGWFENYALSKNVKHISGIEVTFHDLSTAKKYIKNKKVDFKVGTAIKIPYKDNYFDTVVAWEVIEHIPKNTENIMFREVNRVLKKNGVFYLSTPHNSLFSKIFDPAWWLVGHRHYSSERLKQLANENRFKVLIIKKLGGWRRIVLLLNMYISKWVFRRRPMFNNFFSKKEKEDLCRNGFVSIFVKFTKK